ncbi:MAG: hypothetical protein K1X35_09535 [Caulobacteraceae bacterium]|nr:hypothetical protein [Caulobacteraceae bacterium]
MTVDGRWVLAVAAFAAVSLPASAAMPEALPLPPLQPGEAIAVTANGCAMITTASTNEARARFREQTRRSQWRGVCRNGLAHGVGALSGSGPDVSAELFYGRIVPGAVELSSDVSSDDALDHPRWPQEIGSGTRISFGGQNINTFTFGAWPPDYVTTYGIESSGPDGAKTSHCPNRGTPAGCEALWLQLAGPVIAAYRAARAEAERTVGAWRSEISQLNAARDARFAALDAASGDAFDRSMVSAQASGGDPNRDFKARLANANAGQLYAMADQFERAGDTEKAGDALRALLTRFPDHALAVTAAQHLSGLPQGQPAAAPCGAVAQEAQSSAALQAAMDRIPSSNPVWRYEAVLASIQKSAGAWARCPAHPSSAAKIRNYRAFYIGVANTCAMISPTGACTPNLH